MQRLAQRLLVQSFKPSPMYFAIAKTRFTMPLQVRLFSQTDAAVPEHEAEITSFSEDYEQFVKQNTFFKNSKMSLDALTNFISKSLLDRTLSYSEHLDFAPVTEEFAYYVASWSKNNDPSEATMDQAKTLIEFGMQYDIINKQFWKVIVDIV